MEKKLSINIPYLKSHLLQILKHTTMKSASIAGKYGKITLVLKKKSIIYFASSDPNHGIRFIPSDVLSVISSDILSGISSDILSVISSDILSGISSDILSGISSDILSGILFGILYGFVPGR